MDLAIALTPQLKALIDAKVQSGLYESPSEVVREALRMLEEKDRMRAAKLEVARDELLRQPQGADVIPKRARRGAELSQG